MEPTGPDFALIVFKHTEGAERAYADAVSQRPGEPWAQEIAFVEHHQRDRIVVRGTFAGHYVDADDDGDFIGGKTAEGVIAGGAAGVWFGPAGLAVGLVAGGVAGGIANEHSGPHLRSALFDEIRAEVPEGTSAVMLMAGPEEVDAMVSAAEVQGGRVAGHLPPP